MIYRNWVSVFLIKKSVLPYQKSVSKLHLPHQKSVSQIGLPYQKSVKNMFLSKIVFKNRSSLSKIRVATGGVKTRWLGWQFLNGL